jgi:uncharacterized protein (DUF983 family)
MNHARFGGRHVRSDVKAGRLPSRWRAIFAQRCPRCLRGRIYSGLLRMNRVCPVCGHQFQREPGYFLGAMYISYPLSLIVIGLSLWFITSLRPDLRLEWAVFLTIPILVVCVPGIVRWSRVLWMHWDPPHD